MKDDWLAEITRLLHAAGGGDPQAMEQVYASVYPRLRQIARSRLRGQRRDATLDTTALEWAANRTGARSRASVLVLEVGFHKGLEVLYIKGCL